MSQAGTGCGGGLALEKGHGRNCEWRVCRLARARARALRTRVFVCSHRFALSPATLPHLHRDWAHPTHICTGTDRTLLQSGTCVSMAASCAKHTCTHARTCAAACVQPCACVHGHASAVRPASRSSSFSPMHAITCRPASNAHETPRACNVQHGSTRTMQCPNVHATCESGIRAL